MKYMTNFTDINNVLCFDFDYMFEKLLENEKERHKESNKQ